MALMCNKCLSVYHNNMRVQLLYDGAKQYENTNICPHSNCNGRVVMIDDAILPAIIELNRKGYRTLYCCAGHVNDYGASTYIAFGAPYPDTIPEGFIIDQTWGFAIRKVLDVRGEIECGLEILENAKTLLKWAKDLEARHDDTSGA